MFKEFKEFAVKGNVVDMAVGIIIGVAFGAVVKSLVSDVIMPPVGLLFGNVDFSNFFLVLKQGAQAVGPYTMVSEAQKAGAVTLNYGIFVNTVINFAVIAFAMFLVVRSMNRLSRQKEAQPTEPTTKECPYCLSVIPLKATRCAHCASELKGQ